MTDLFHQLATGLGPTYRLERELGGGGMSRVFVAEETRLGRKDVIKVLPPEASAGIPADRFEREIRLAASLQHPNVVQVLNAGAAGELVYYVMPYIAGESLASRIAREGALPVPDAIRILHQVADALAYAHAQGVVHRDIKPDNILLGGRHALVADFGVAKAVSAAAAGLPRTTLTEAGFTLGTPAYMAPEQATADPQLDHRADIYSLGAVAYEMLAGRSPFSAPTPQGMIAAHVALTPEPVDRYRPGVPVDLAGIVMRCLEKHPADRWQTAEALLDALDALPVPTPATGVRAAVRQTTGTAETAETAGTAAASLRSARVLAYFGVAGLVITAGAYALSRVVGLPDWVWIGALVCVLAGLPIMLYTGRLERRRAVARATGSYRVSGERPHHRLFTWRRAVLGGALALGTLTVVAVAWAASRTLGIGPAATLLSAGTLDARDRLVLADFENRTPDSTLGDAVTEALRVDLAQSRVVRLLDQRLVSGALQRMGARPDTVLHAAMAREVAVREGAKAIVTGEITPLGSGYVLTARIVSADSGATLVPVRVTAADPGALIDAVNRLSAELRERVGESLKSIRDSEPLERVTTASLPALRLYTEGARVFLAGDYERSRELLERAVAIDSGFATAWRKLGATYFNSGAPLRLRLNAAERAFRHRDRLPPLERHLAEAYYYTDADRDSERAIAAYRAALDVAPDDVTATNNLSIILNREGRWAEAEAILRRAIDLDGPPTLFINLNYALLSQAKWAAADSFVDRAARSFPGHHAPFAMRLDIVAARRDFAAQDSLAAAGVAADETPPRIKQFLVWERVGTLEARGRFAEARQVAEELRRLALSLGDTQIAAGASLEPAIQNVFTGRTDEARRQLAETLEGPIFRALPD
ncbi:MAG: protein kinase, partial [Gemmatimonadota bacterium]|nr:protein kinase [Gemmatimonadota bacterium]